MNTRRQKARQVPLPDLTLCDQEPIHSPGHIQPHGVLVATEPGGRTISHISANFAASVGLPERAWLGTDIDRLLGRAAFAAVEQALDDRSYAPSNVLRLTLPVPVRPRRRVLAHRHLGRMIIEMEDAPLDDEAGAALSRAQNIIASLRRAPTVARLCDAAVQEMRSLTGYDRVMIYRFDAAGHGAVVAEDRRSRLPPFLDLHYPASDIPQQARRLYVLQRVRSIPDMAYRPVALLSADGSELDMSFCALRGISPVHLEYMHNMGVRASLAVSLLQDDGLWGMIVCHHMTPLAPTADMRALYDVIAQLMSTLLQRVTETEALVGRLGRNRTIMGLRHDIDLAGGVTEGLCHQAANVLNLLDAGGALIRCGGDLRLIGETPPLAAAAAVVDTMLLQAGDRIACVADAGQPNGPAASFAGSASGVLVLPLTGNAGANAPGDVIAWFRPEVARTVRWAGDPRKPVGDTSDGVRLSPRKSFAAWTELVRGCSAPWRAVDVQAAEDLRRTVTQALLHQAHAQLARLSAYDALTGLANRGSMEAQLKRWQLVGAPAAAALLFIDLDRFKVINDTLGHAAGDACLVQVAARLRHLAPGGSLPGRLGGDEFLLFWPGAAPASAMALAAALVEELARPFLLDGGARYSGASIGVACAPIAGMDGMMRQADAAMYAAKRQGGGQAVLFDPGLHEAVLANMQTEQDLFRAVEANQLEVHYQPLVTVADRLLCGFEALVRWRHPDRGWVSPAEFIPLAEEAGLIARIGAWVLGEVIGRLAVWRDMAPALTVSVNVSARQLTDGSLAARLPEMLAARGVPAAALCLEVTESALMDHVAVRELGVLRALGLTIAVDDFGTGHSSLAYLNSLPVDKVKIDRGFVAPLGSNAKANRFFTAIVDLARTIDLGTVAEGCETAEQWRAIEAAGCDMVQGWLVARAMDAAAAERFIVAPPAWAEGVLS